MVCLVGRAMIFPVYRSTSFSAASIDNRYFSPMTIAWFTSTGWTSMRESVALHAYCLMTNHVHLLLSATSVGTLGGLMQDIGRRYVPYVIAPTIAAAGSGRVDISQATCRASAIFWPVCATSNSTRCVPTWSRHPANIAGAAYRTNALGEADKLVTQHSEYLALGASPEARQQAFRELFVSEIDEPAWLLIRAAT